MAIYWLFWFWICICNFVFITTNITKIPHPNYKDYKILEKILFFLTMVGIVIFVGLRYQVGGDWFNYIIIYEKYAHVSIEEIWESRDIGYAFLNFVSQKLGFKDTIFVNLICAIIIAFCLLKLAYYLKLYWLVLIVYFPYHLLVISNGYTRQSVAIALSLILFIYLVERRIFYFLISLAIASLFHQTSILLLLFFPIIFFSGDRKYDKKYVVYVTFSGLALLVMLIYLSKTDNIYVQDDMSSKGFVLRWVYHCIPILIYLKYRKYIQIFHVYIFDLFLFFICLVAVIGIFYSTLADRFNFYLIFFDIYMVFFALKNITNTTSRKSFLLLFVMAYHTLLIAIWMFMGEWASMAWIPYSNYLFNFYREVF